MLPPLLQQAAEALAVAALNASSVGVPHAAAAAVLGALPPSPPLPPPPHPPMPGCTASYGFLPCTTNAMGAAFLALVYGYLVLRGAMLIGDGGEELMELRLAPAVLGGLVLPIIGALPDALIIINSGLHESRSEAREEIAVGMGTLAGSTVMLLTVVWGGSVLAGRCDLDPSTGLMRDRTLTRPRWDFKNTGVSTDAATPRCAWAMLATTGLYAAVQLPALFMQHTRRTPLALAGAALCFASLALYCAHQVATPAAARRRILAVHKHALRFHAVRSFSFAAQRFGGLLDPATGAVRRDVTDRLFAKFKRDEAGCLDASDVRAMLIGLEIAKPVTGLAALRGGGSVTSGSGLDGRALDDHVALWMREFDPAGRGHIDADAFHAGVARWVEYKLRRSPLAASPKFQKRRERDPAGAAAALLEHIDGAAAEPLAEAARRLGCDDLGDPYTDDSDVESAGGSGGGGGGAPFDASSSSDGGGSSAKPPPPRWVIAARAATWLALGAALCGVFSDPLVGAVADLSRATRVPPFFIAFIFMPLASNASELVSSLAFAAGKTSSRISVTFNQVYGAVVLNSTLCFGCFLSVLHARRLPWVFAPEVAVIVAPTLLLGAFAARRRSWPASWGVAALAGYPVALLAQWALTLAFGSGGAASPR